jgi:hypothetical protein
MIPILDLFGVIKLFVEGLKNFFLCVVCTRCTKLKLNVESMCFNRMFHLPKANQILGTYCLRIL